jgi:hypothetical protein
LCSRGFTAGEVIECDGALADVSTTAEVKAIGWRTAYRDLTLIF